VLSRAFAAPLDPWRGPVDGARALQLAGDLSLNGRIGARAPKTLLERELGEQHALALVRAAAASAALRHRALALIREIGSLAQQLGIPWAPLKGAALAALGCAQGRWMSDVDILVPKGQAEPLFQALLSQGFAAWGGSRVAHHWPLLHRDRQKLELHTYLPGIRLPEGTGLVDFSALQRAGLVADAPALLGESGHLLAREALAAHLVAHALLQHRFSPRSYPGIRLLADLQELGFWGGAAEPAWRGLLERVRIAVKPEELAALRELTVALEGLREHKGWDLPLGELAARLLGHWLAGALDARYQQRLRLQAIFAVGAKGGFKGWARALWHTVVLDELQVELLYGPQPTRWHTWGRKLFRPVDLLLRTLRAVASWRS
jgi:hypothetical protein